MVDHTKVIHFAGRTVVFDDCASGNWKTIESSEGNTHICIENGKIVAGPKSLVGSDKNVLSKPPAKKPKAMLADIVVPSRHVSEKEAKGIPEVLPARQRKQPLTAQIVAQARHVSDAEAAGLPSVVPVVRSYKVDNKIASLYPSVLPADAGRKS